ncbi:TonB-dependent receptor [Sphingobacterium sp. SRCM116780]|uniref:SusC/RagA family TonB-linked outer membrane protein n=1 Tax=Sphingobacterium sp. SRCM116780 TaxID=2907623 RepID=UPI001F451915|nr:TonB-dependent receptor [Sphingobacterium sp. SRCM116780]UIR57940.1 TonB-dependent receptor [Sphingobacterium sp. SRCM116780]
MQKTILISFALCLSYPSWANYEHTHAKRFQSMHLQTKQNSIRGVVKDKDGQPLSGVTVTNLTTQQTIGTNNSGEFSIPGSPGQKLKFSIIGYKDNTLQAGSGSLQITMESSDTSLEEVVVVGYGTQKKANLTGAVDQVGSEVFKGRALSNVSQMLQGAVPNLNIIPADGKPTRNPSFNIRGTTSIGQGGSALILIDGVEGDPGALNPNDIESVSVLKDASSAAIYGSRGTFGVVLITTKRANSGRTSITYSGNASFQKPVTLPDFVTDGYTYASHFFTAYNAWNNYSSIPSKLNKTQIFTTDWLEEFKRRKEQGISEQTTVDDKGNYVYYGNEDYYGTLIKDNTFVQDHNLSVSGNEGKLDYYLSGRAYDYNGMYRYNTDKYSTYNTRAKAGLQVTDWLRVTNNIDYSYAKYWDPSTGGEGGNIWRNIADEGHPSSPIFNPDGSLSFSAAYTVGDFIYGKNGTDTENRDLRNTSAFETKFLNNSLRIKGDLTFRNRDFHSLRVKVPVPYSVQEGKILKLETSLNNNIYQVDQNWKYLFSNLYGEYEKTIGDHYFKGLLGYNYEQRRYESTYITKTGLLTENTENINLALGQNTTATAGYNKYRNVGVFMRANYIFKDRYLFEFNGRYDGSSKFPTHEQWAFFPSGSVGWRVSQEPFWTIDNTVISDFKLRASYGSLGNGNIDPYSYLDQYTIAISGRILNGMRNPYTSVPVVIPDNLTWETARTANVGIDISAIHSKLSFTGDIYQRKTLNMYTVGQQLPEIFGAASPKGNYADMTTSGFELSVGYKDNFDVNGNQFNWSLKGTLADYRSTIDRYNNETGILTDYYAGERLGEIWGYKTYGLFQNQAEIDGAPTQKLIKSSNSGKIYPGDVRFSDLDGNGVIDYGSNTLANHGDKTIIGNSEPRYIYGFNVNLDWNNVYFGTFFQGVGKQQWYPSNESIFWGQYNRPYNNLPTWHLDNYWTEENTDAYLPRYAGYNESIKINTQSRYLQNVAFIRMKNIQIGYNFPNSITSKMKLRSLRMGLSGENLWTWSPLYKHTKDLDVGNLGKSDPDVSSSNSGDGFNYPVMKSISFNLSIGL